MANVGLCNRNAKKTAEWCAEVGYRADNVVVLCCVSRNTQRRGFHFSRLAQQGLVVAFWRALGAGARRGCSCAFRNELHAFAHAMSEVRKADAACND
jgi:hypothetical protein